MAFRKARGHLKINPGRGVANNIEKRWNFMRKLGENCSITALCGSELSGSCGGKGIMSSNILFHCLMKGCSKEANFLLGFCRMALF